VLAYLIIVGPYPVSPSRLSCPINRSLDLTAPLFDFLVDLSCSPCPSFSVRPEAPFSFRKQLMTHIRSDMTE